MNPCHHLMTWNFNLEESADQRYGELRADLEKRGATIGPNDMLIATHAGLRGRHHKCPGVLPGAWIKGRELASVLNCGIGMAGSHKDHVIILCNDTVRENDALAFLDTGLTFRLR